MFVLDVGEDDGPGTTDASHNRNWSSSQSKHLRRTQEGRTSRGALDYRSSFPELFSFLESAGSAETVEGVVMLQSQTIRQNLLQNFPGKRLRDLQPLEVFLISFCASFSPFFPLPAVPFLPATLPFLASKLLRFREKTQPSGLGCSEGFGGGHHTETRRYRVLKNGVQKLVSVLFLAYPPLRKHCAAQNYY